MTDANPFTAQPQATYSRGCLGESRDGAQAERHERAEADAERCEHDERDNDSRRERQSEQGVGQRRQGEQVEGVERSERAEEHPRGAAGSQLVARAEQRADAGEEQDRRQRDRQRVGRVAEEQRQPLDQRDLEEHEAQPERGEVERRPSLPWEPRPDAPDADERQQEEDGGEQRRDAEQQQQHPFADVDLEVAPVDRLPEVGDHVAERGEVPEERPVVGDRPDVVGVGVVPTVELGFPAAWRWRSPSSPRTGWPGA